MALPCQGQCGQVGFGGTVHPPPELGGAASRRRTPARRGVGWWSLFLGVAEPRGVSRVGTGTPSFPHPGGSGPRPGQRRAHPGLRGPGEVRPLGTPRPRVTGEQPRKGGQGRAARSPAPALPGAVSRLITVRERAPGCGRSEAAPSRAPGGCSPPSPPANTHFVVS